MYGRIGALKGPGPFEIRNIPAGPFAVAFVSDEKDSAMRKQATLDLVLDSDMKDLEFNLQGALKVRFKLRSFGDHPIDGDPL